MHGGSIVDATIINAPGSTKNASKQRDPEMHQTQKGNNWYWYFGMKAHIGVDAGTGYVHTVETTAANVHDVTVASRLIREDDHVVYGDAGSLGIQKRLNARAHSDKPEIDFRINRRRGSVPSFLPGCINWEKQIERQKSSVRSKAAHPFLIIKKYFGYAMVAYKGLAKNTHRLYVLFACSNLVMCSRAGRELPAGQIAERLFKEGLEKTGCAS